MTTVDLLLAECESLPHAGRMRRLAELGRAARDDSAVRAVIAELERGDVYQRLLALQSCYGSRDGARVLRALTDPSRLIRTFAVSLAGLACDDEQMADALHHAGRRLPWLLGSIRGKRGAVVDRFIANLATTGDERLPRLAPYASPELLARLPPSVFERADAVAWARLARLHPDVAADLLDREASSGARFPERTISIAGIVIPAVARSRPDHAVALVRRLLLTIPLSRLALQELVDRRPAELADLMLTSTDRPYVAFDAVAHRLDDARLLALIDRGDALLGEPSGWLARLAPDRRAAIIDACRAGWSDDKGFLPAHLIALLPGDRRAAEARRHLALPARQASPTRFVDFALFLPWSDARAALAEELTSPDADLRRAALTPLIGSVRYDRAHVADLFAFLEARRNEQDPVRGDIMAALAKLPPGIWPTERLDGLGRLIRAALDAVDLSAGTLASTIELIVRLLPFHREWAVAWLAAVARHRGELRLDGVAERATPADAALLAEALLPILLDWERRDRHQAIVESVEGFGRLVVAAPQLVDLLVRMLNATRDAGIADRIPRLLREDVPERLNAVFPALLASDSSWIRRPVVLDLLHARRQDLLTPFLSAPTTPGRFDAGKVRYALPLDGGFVRWTGAQQAIFAAMLAEMTADPADATPSAAWAIPRLAALPSAPKERLIALAALATPNQGVRDQALLALGRLDGPEGIPTLFAALADERARLAIYALRRSLLALPPREALRLLRQAPRDRVTVAKEAVRLIGELRLEEAYQELLTLDATELHRDVRVALIRALWGWLERDETWEILERAATSPSRNEATWAVNLPVERLSLTARDRAIRLFARLLAHPDAYVRRLALDRFRGQPLDDPDRLLVAPLLRLLASDDEEATSAAALLFANYAAEDERLVHEVVERLLPRRRVLGETVAAFKWATGWRRERNVPIVRALIAALERDPLTIAMRCELAIRGLPAAEIAALLIRSAETGVLHAEALIRAADTLEGGDVAYMQPSPALLYQPFPRRATAGFNRRRAWSVTWSRRREAILFTSADQFNADDLALLESRLGSSADPALRRVALSALKVAARDRHGWTDARRARLEGYRRDPAVLVAAAAHFTVPPVPATTSDSEA